MQTGGISPEDKSQPLLQRRTDFLLNDKVYSTSFEYEKPSMGTKDVLEHFVQIPTNDTVQEFKCSIL